MLTAVMFVWEIVKIIGLVLLVILGLLFLLLVLILLAPVRYQVEGSYYGTPKGTAKVTWLFPVVAAKAVYEEKLTLIVRILGIKAWGMEKSFGKSKEGESDGGEEHKEAAGESKDPHKENQDFLEENLESGEVSQASEVPEPKKFQEEKAVSDAGESSEKEDGFETAESSKGKKGIKKRNIRKKKKRRKRFRGFSINRFCDKIREKINRIKDKLRSLKKKKKKIKKFLCDEKNHRTFRLLIRQLKKLLFHVLPKKAVGKVRFGFEDPSTTGQVLTYVSPFYGLYGQQVELIPVFDESVIEGEGRIKGRIRVGTVLALAVRMLFDKNFRTLLKKCLKA